MVEPAQCRTDLAGISMTKYLQNSDMFRLQHHVPLFSLDLNYVIEIGWD